MLGVDISDKNKELKSHGLEHKSEKVIILTRKGFQSLIK